MKRVKFFLAFLALSLFFIFNPCRDPQPAAAFQAMNIMVTNTNDSGDGSLRAAITAVNNAMNSSTIQFNIPTTDPGFNGTIFRIRVMSELPAITRNGVVIDGSAGVADTNPLGPEIVLDGSLAPSGANGLILSSNNNNIRSLVIQNFVGGDGIRLNDNTVNSIISGCYIGTDETGRVAAGNLTGIRIQNGSNTNIIGGSLTAGNLISGNLGDGIVITGMNSDNNTLAGNIIGLDNSGTLTPLPNLGDGIEISAGPRANAIGGPNSGNIIGGNMGNGILITGMNTMGNRVTSNSIGTAPGNLTRGNGLSGVAILDGANMNTIGDVNLGNIIAFNGSDGITVGAATTEMATNRNRLSRNSIFSNGGLGIDLANNGVTNNDAGDSDSGPNNLQNFPVINNITVLGSAFTVTGTIDTPMPNTVTIEVYTNTVPIPAGDPSGFGEGQNFVASVIPNAMGSFTAAFISNPNVVVTLLAIDSMGNTSEFSSFMVGVGGNTADLQVRNLMVTPATANPGDPIRVNFSVTNAGNASAAANMVAVRLSTDAVIDMNDLLLDSRAVDMLMGGASTQFSIDLRVPMNLMPGSFTIGVVADSGATVMESNEMNNTATAALAVSGNVDFALTNLVATPATGSPGSTVTLSATLTNNGTLPAPAALVEVRLSNDQVITSADTLLGTFNSMTLARGQSLTLSFTATIPPTTTPGPIFLGFVIDPANQVMEVNEANNVVATQFAVVDTTAPVVTVTAPNGGEQLPAGSTFTITWMANDNVGIVSQDVLLSTDGGANFGTVIASGLGGTVRSFVFTVPMLNTGTAQVRIVARDGAGNVGSDNSDANFSIGVRPLIISPVFTNGKLKIIANGSNIQPGAVLVVINGASMETFTLGTNSTGSRFIIRKSQTSMPSGLRLSQVVPVGVTVMFVVRNPNGIESLPAAFQRQQ